MNLMTAGVASGLVGASTGLKTADAAMGVYQKAKGEGNEASMKRALGYAADSMNGAEESSERTQEALAEAKTQAEKTAREGKQAANSSSSGDTVDIRRGGAVQKTGTAQAADGEVSPSQAALDNPALYADAATPAAVMYTARGVVKPAVMPPPTLTVSA